MASTQTPSQSFSNRISRAVEEGDWTLIKLWVDSGQLSEHQKIGVLVEISRSTNTQQFLQRVLSVCSSTQIDSAMTQLISEGLWKDVLNLSITVGEENREWNVGDHTVDNKLLCLVAGGRWDELSAELHRRVHLAAPQKRWALLQVCGRATQRDVQEIVIPHCTDENLHSALKKLVSRRFWWAVGILIKQRRAISNAQRIWAMNKAAKEATTWELSEYILPLCTKKQLKDVSVHLLTRRLWWAVHDVLNKDPHTFIECILQVFGNTDMDLFMSHLVSEGQWNSVQKLLLLTRKVDWRIGDVFISRQNIKFAADGRWGELTYQARARSNQSLLAWVMLEMSKRAGRNEIGAIVVDRCPSSQIPFVLESVIKRGFMDSAAKLLHRFVVERQEGWVSAGSGVVSESELWSMVTNMSFDVKVVSELCIEIHKEKQMYMCNFNLTLAKQICQIVRESALDIVLVSLCIHRQRSATSQSVSREVILMIDIIQNEIRLRNKPHDLQQTIQRLCTKLDPAKRTGSVRSPLFALTFIREIMNRRFSGGYSQIGDIVNILTTVPVVPDVQCNALKAMLLEKKWSVIYLADLSQVCEVVRRQLFQAAVKQKKWDVVRQWADHTLYDDQRTWALKKACDEKQWRVVLDLAGDGLTDEEVTRVHYLVARYADWDVVLDMYKREADVSEVKELLTTAARGVTVKVDERQELMQRVRQLADVEADMKCRMESLNTLESAVEQGEWQLVVFTIRQRPEADSMCLALKAAVSREAWHTVIQLFRLGMHTFDELSFFHQMIETGQWRVCAVMIEQGLNVDLYVDAIPKLMELNQWNLVAKMMEHDVEDAVRRRVMQCALEKKQGTVVSQSVNGMKQGLTLQEREDLFHKAIIYDVPQAMRPLVGVKDDTGVRHRDAALLHAIRQQQWDIVDLCRHHNANMDVLDENGNTPALIKAKEGNWESVMALIKRGGDPTVVGSGTKSVLHMAIAVKEWECVKLLITYPCQMQQAAADMKEQDTLLEMLIKANQESIVEYAILHHGAQWNGVNYRGETALHTICFFGVPNILCSLLNRGVDPLSVTHRGHSALSYAVLSQYPWKMVTECVSNGLTTHQPHITESITSQRTSPFLSPVLLAVMLGLHRVTQMLYESGSCSRKELFQVLPELVRLADPSTQGTDCSLLKRFKEEIVRVYSRKENENDAETSYRWLVDTRCPFKRPQTSLVRKCALYLMEVCRTPRSLKSMCRLVISHCLPVCGSRDSDISQLPICNPLKDYLLFPDLLAIGDDQSSCGRQDDARSDGKDSEDDHSYYDEDVYDYMGSSDESMFVDTDEDSVGWAFDSDDQEYTDDDEVWPYLF